jgi:penicillin amidase
MIVDFSDPGSAVGIFPGGQSGDPRSLHYDDLIDDWARGEYVSLLFYPSHEEFPAEQIEERLKLLPPLPHVESTIP